MGGAGRDPGRPAIRFEAQAEVTINWCTQKKQKGSNMLLRPPRMRISGLTEFANVTLTTTGLLRISGFFYFCLHLNQKHTMSLSSTSVILATAPIQRSFPTMNMITCMPLCKSILHQAFASSRGLWIPSATSDDDANDDIAFNRCQ